MPRTDVSTLSDRQLLLAGRATVVAANRAFAQRLLFLTAFYNRRAATYAARLEEEPHFTLTARQETVVEVGELWGLSEAYLRRWLNNALYLLDRLPEVWAMVAAGQLSEYQVKLVVEAARDALDPAAGEQVAAYDEQMVAFLRKRLRGVDDLAAGEHAAQLVCCTTRQLSNRIAYLKARLRPAEAEARHRQRYADRRVAARETDDGMASLSIASSVDRVQVAWRRLTLNAQQLRAAGDERTLDQLRADLAIDLIAGTKTVNDEGDVVSVPPPAFARPVVNVTVPIQTLLGIGDLPGTLGGSVIPAGLARAIAADESSTWYRMLTDPVGSTESQLVELSTRSYQPTPAIWRTVVAEHGTCFRSHCDTPASQAELDHRTAWPDGATSTGNLWPACKTDHKAKHAPGFGIEQQPDGSWVLLTPTGFRHPIPRTAHPTSDHFPDLPIEPGDFQFSVTELAHALARLRHDAQTLIDPADLWEEDPWHPGIEEWELMIQAAREDAAAA
jgi:hypothetical protein